MKKFLRFLMVFLAVVVGILLSLSLYEPQDVPVVRSIMIKAPKEVVFEQMSQFKNWPNWSPWYAMDSSMKMTYSGTDGKPGSSYHWKGEANITGEGDMQNDGIEGTTMNYDIAYTSPRAGRASGYVKAKDTAGMTRATWCLIMHVGFPFNAMCAFMNMDRILGGDLEVGLVNLKKYTESHSAAAPVIDIKEVDYPAHTFEGIRQVVPMSGITKFFMDAYGTLGKELGPKITGPAAGLYFTWDTVNKSTDMAAVFPVTDTAKKATGTSVFHPGPAKAYMAIYKGGYSAEGAYHAAIAKRIAEKGQKQSLVIEEYIVGPHDLADSSKWVTDIYYLVQ